MARLYVENLYKRFGAVIAVDHISFTVEDGEFLTLLGPSGCGKSTTLAAVAGLDVPDGGRIGVDDVVFFDSSTGRYMPPEQRNCGLVFQSYALWPHMTVFENLAFPLKLRKVPRHEQEKRIMETLELVELAHFASRYPHQLSGGQQQRVALARALVYRPRLLLLDEPLSNLDAKLRERARSWLKQLQSQLGITTVYVTHDQVEALALSDRIAVMRDGRIVQMGRPHEIYEEPAEPFVADFIGTSNFIAGRVVAADDGSVTVRLDGSEQAVRVTSRSAFAPGSPVVVSVRPEKISLLPPGQEPPAGGENVLEGTVVHRAYLGARYQYQLQVGTQTIRAESDLSLPEGKVLALLSAAGTTVFGADRIEPMEQKSTA